MLANRVQDRNDSLYRLRETSVEEALLIIGTISTPLDSSVYSSRSPSWNTYLLDIYL